MLRKKNGNIRELKQEAWGRYECFIASQLDAKAEVSTRELAKAFYEQEEPILKRIASAMMLHVLVKWADDILGQSVAAESARNGHPQLVLPVSLRGIEVPGAISFIGGANNTKWVANYKVVGWQMDSHAYLLRKHDEEVHASRLEFEKLLAKTKPHMDADPKMTLPTALAKIIETEGN
jgi:hypothetical protein